MFVARPKIGRQIVITEIWGIEASRAVSVICYGVPEIAAGVRAPIEVAASSPAELATVDQRNRMSIYVEIRIRAPLQDLWDHTQRPDLHERWDLRFSSISYMPRPNADEPQRFRYVTRIGGGLSIEGQGESVGSRDLESGQRASALTFSSLDPRSLILRGSGYWKYIPTADGIRFLTRYDYETRWGPFGRFIDRVLFRPALGWATAWSFDRLRLWLEEHVDPRSAWRQWITHAVARVSLAIIFAYHGLVPKLLLQQADEMSMLRDIGVPAQQLPGFAFAFGIAEVLFAICLLLFWRSRWPALLTFAFGVFATIGVAYASPRYLGAAFNPVSLNLAIVCLAIIDLLNLEAIPTAESCRRTPPAGEN
jgi:uncharacterized membrane protein YphA (DoxX/SURF4 family)